MDSLGLTTVERRDARAPDPASRPGSVAQTRSSCQQCRGERQLFPITMAFQPVADIAERRIDAFEALVRGPAGEGAGQILAQVTATNLYAFDQTCRVKAIELAASLGLNRPLNINFLPNAVYEPRACIRATLDAAARTGFDPGLLTFEITETEFIADSAHLRRIIQEYRRLGFKIALDDFCTGYSGLSRLVELSPDIVKLDRALISGCDQDRFKLSVVGSMLKLCEDLGCKVVLEGVETEGEFLALRDAGARFMQGYFLRRPQFEALSSDGDVFDHLPR